MSAAESQLQLSELRKVRQALMEPLWTKFSARAVTVKPELVSLLVDNLVKLERYERRALSRRRRALRVLGDQYKR